jgi:hypothetical protein
MSNKLKWVVSLAGYATTPAEDMHDATLAPEAEKAAELPTEIKKKPAAVAPLTPQSSGTASPRSTAPVVPQAAAPLRTPSPASRAERPSPTAVVRVITDPQARRFYALWKSAGKEKSEVERYLREEIGVQTDREIPVAQYTAACEWAAGRF